MILHQFDAKTFLPAAADMDRLQLAAFDTLPHGLTRDAETPGGFLNGDIALAGLVDETGAKLVGDANAPGC